MKKKELIIIEFFNTDDYVSTPAYFYDESTNEIYVDDSFSWKGDVSSVFSHYNNNEDACNRIKFYRVEECSDSIILSDYSIRVNVTYDEYETMNEVLKYSYNRDCVLCNIIHEIDDSIYKNALFDWDDVNVEILQWYITSFSKSDAEYLSEHTELLITYSDLLDCYILCMTQMESWDSLQIGVNVRI